MWCTVGAEEMQKRGTVLGLLLAKTLLPQGGLMQGDQAGYLLIGSGAGD